MIALIVNLVLIVYSADHWWVKTVTKICVWLQFVHYSVRLVFQLALNVHVRSNRKLAAVFSYSTLKIKFTTILPFISKKLVYFYHAMLHRARLFHINAQDIIR